MLTSNERKLDAFPALVLNADFRPVEYLPLSIMPWQDAVNNALAGDVTIVHEYDVEAHSPSVTIRLPAVIALRRFVKRREIPPLTRYNLLTLRDRGACAYCGRTFPAPQMTIDHVIPKAQSGKHRWENTVGACSDCNQRKADRTPEQARMPLLWRPWQPSMEELARVDYFQHQRRMHECWREFIPFAA